MTAGLIVSALRGLNAAIHACEGQRMSGRTYRGLQKAIRIVRDLEPGSWLDEGRSGKTPRLVFVVAANLNDRARIENILNGLESKAEITRAERAHIRVTTPDRLEADTRGTRAPVLWDHFAARREVDKCLEALSLALVRLQRSIVHEGPACPEDPGYL